ncbi:helix-turn-helix domain-containing protein, partial [Ralstonia pseudosolanacearum]|uniref:helix-turn-helix domain-containing protein n=1 Tax=Ralstonia pseudosolanacearum TaxID=1310165 RepID=UPI003CFAA54B
MQKRTIQPKRPVPVRAAGSEPSSSLQWDDIRHFLALAREGSLSAAARRPVAHRGLMKAAGAVQIGLAGIGGA